jgi:hypothetical protein
MASIKLKCPKCKFEETSYQSRPHAEPPCPRCPGFVRMEVVPPPPEGTQTIYSSGGQKP